MSALLSMMRLLTVATVAGILAVGAATVTPAEPASAATDPSCRVVNATRGGSHQTLAAAVKAAKNGNKLLVKGACKGATRMVKKRLTIEGRWSRKKGAPTLRSNGVAPVLTLEADGTSATLKKLTIRGNPAKAIDASGPGIKISYTSGGVLKLIDVKIRDLKTKRDGGCIANVEGRVELWGNTVLSGCTAAQGQGGGIYNQSGDLMVAGQSVIKRNRAGSGGGVMSSGGFSTVLLRSLAIVANNQATNTGGGVYLSGGTGVVAGNAVISRNSAGTDGGGIRVGADETDLTLGGASKVTGNAAGFGGGGVKFKGRKLTMAGSSSITGNTAVQGGGLNSAGWTTLVGVVCASDAGANVSGNSPDDCHRG